MLDLLLSSAVARSPAPWIILAALLSGAAISSATRRTRRAADPEAARTRKWILFSVGLSGAVAAWLLGFFVPGPEKISLTHLFFYLAATVLFGLGFRFRKSVGLALVICGVAAATVVLLFTKSLTAYSGETEICRVVVYALRDTGLDVEIRAPGRPVGYAHLEGQRMAPMVRSVFFLDLWPGLGWRSWYRFEGLTAYTAVSAEGGTAVRWAPEPYVFPRDDSVPEKLYALFEEHIASIPGARIVRSETIVDAGASQPADRASGELEELREYTVLLKPDGRVALTAASR